METIIKVVFEEIEGKAYCFRFTKASFGDIITTRCGIYAAIADSLHTGPGDDDYQTMFNLVNGDGEIVEDFYYAHIYAAIDWNRGGVINMESYEGYYSSIASFVNTVLQGALHYTELFDQGLELPNEAEFHESTT